MIHIYTSVSSFLVPSRVLFRIFCALVGFYVARAASVSWRSGAERCAEPPLRTLLSTGIQESRLLNLGANRGLSAGACLNLLLIENVRWSLLCRSGKVRGWHFNCAYVIYGARRASLALLNTLLVVDGCQIGGEIREMAISGDRQPCVCVFFSVKAAVTVCALPPLAQWVLSSRITAWCDFTHSGWTLLWRVDFDLEPADGFILLSGFAVTARMEMTCPSSREVGNTWKTDLVSPLGAWRKRLHCVFVCQKHF